jgi:PAS domain S-box-containing protein
VRATAIWDITERKRAEDALRASEATRRAILEAVPDLLFRVDRDGVFLDYRAARESDLFVPPREFLGKPMAEVLPAHLAGPAMACVRETLETGRPSVFEYQLRLGGEVRDFEARHAALGDDVLIIVRDFTDRKRAERAFAEESERLLVTLRSIGDAVITTDEAGRVVLMNGVAERMTGYAQSEARGLPLSTVFRVLHERTREARASPAERILECGEGVTLAGDAILVARDGTERLVADSAAPIRDREGRVVGAVLVFRDVTEQRRADRELQRMEKLESIGVLAGGIAHDFNNILTVVWGNASLARVLAVDRPDIRERLVAAEQALVRARDLTQRLLSFAKGGSPTKRTSSIGELLREACSFGLSGSRSRCELTVPDDLWPVDLDSGQIAEVVHNLVLNADQAMPAGGTIRVGADNVLIPERTLPVPSGRYVRVSVTDAGTGIAPENLSRIFDPYFTTKEDGTGLGLAICASIVRNHRGCITVRSRPGEGTTFHVHLPASEGRVPVAGASQEQGLRGAVRKGRVLVLDDDPGVRAVLDAMLGRLGYECVAVATGEEVLERWARGVREDRPFDLVILDLTIPGAMGGLRAMGELRAAHPGVKAIVATGYAQDPVMASFGAYGFLAAMGKPFTIEVLSETLGKVLGPGA